jgi:MinD-like ATPase involved in chromosome partitioning or flagellar assembly
MTVIALGAVRSCGTTTSALAIAATWPDDQRVLLCECDPAGGTIAAAAGWGPEPGLVSLAAAARRDPDPEIVWSHTQEIPNGAAVLAGPASAEQAVGALGMLTGLLGRLGELKADVLVDCGRLRGSFPESIQASADQLILVARPALPDLHAVAAWREAQPSDQRPMALVLVGEGPYSDIEISQALEMSVLARLPWDAQASSALVSISTATRSLSRSALVRSARTLANQVSGQTPATHSVEMVPEPSLSRLRTIRRSRAAAPADSAMVLLDELRL